MGKNKNRILRFAVTGALLAGTPAMACGGGASDAHSNEPAPTHSNEPAPESTNEAMVEDTAGDEAVEEPVEEPTVNEVPAESEAE